MRKRILSVLMALCMVLSLAPATAWAASNNAPTSIYVGGIELTNNKCLTSNSATDASDYTNGDNYVALYQDGVLTLKDATITGAYEKGGAHDLIGIYTNGALNIVLEGNNRIVGQSYFDGSYHCTSYGMDIGGALTFSGDGSLEVSAANCDMSNSTSAAIYVRNGDITVAHECTIVAYCGNSGNIKRAINGNNLNLNKAKVTGNKTFEGDPTVVSYNANTIDNHTSYKYLRIEPAVTKTVTVNNGTGGGDYAEGESVTITANTPVDGKQFKEWTGVDGLTFTSGSATSATATFTMPNEAVTVTATYKDIPATPATYTVSFDKNGGTGEMAAVTVVKDATYSLPACTFTAPEGKEFDGWSADGGATKLSDTKITVTTNTTLTALWKDKATTPSTGIGSGESGARSYKTADGKNLFLGGDYIELGLRSNGAFGTSVDAPTSGAVIFHPTHGELGLRSNGNKTWAEGVITSGDHATTDYFLPGMINEGWLLGWATTDGGTLEDKGLAQAYGGTAEYGLSDHALVDASTTSKLKAEVSAEVADTVKVEQEISFEPAKKYFETKVTLTNKGDATLYDLSFIRAFDPDQKSGFIDYETDNYFYKDSEGNVWVMAFGNNSKNVGDTPIPISYDEMVTNNKNLLAPFIFCAPTPAAGITVQAIDGPISWSGHSSFSSAAYGNHYYDDKSIGLEFQIESLAKDQSVTFTYISSLDTDIDDALGGVQEELGTCTVSFDANGGSGFMSAQTFTKDVAQALTENAFTRDGYAFAGWNTAVNGSGTSYADKQSVIIGATCTLYAQWTENSTPTPPSSTPSSKPKYPAKLTEDADVENGNISFSQTRVKAGRTVTITVTPDAGFALDKLVILDKDGDEVTFKDNGDGTYTFTMPSGGVEVEPFFVAAAPETEPVTLVLFVNQVAYLLDGEPLVNDVAPVIKAERTTLPIRLVAETLGAKVDWSEADQTVTITKDDMTIVIYIGQGFALVNGDPVELDAAAFIANDRTYLPVRFVSENLGAEVTWGGADGSVTIVVK